jgi:transposase
MAWGVMQRTVRRDLSRNRQRNIHYQGVDEKAFRKGHSYMTVVNDLSRATMKHVSEERKTASLEEYHRSLKQGQLQTIQAVAMDMCPPTPWLRGSGSPDARVRWRCGVGSLDEYAITIAKA